MDDPLMTAADVVEREIRVRRAVVALRNPAIADLVRLHGSAPKAADSLLAEMVHRGYQPDEVTGVGAANVQRIARELGT